MQIVNLAMDKMTFKEYLINETLEKQRKAINKIVNDLHKKGKKDPKEIADHIKNAMEIDNMSRDEIISRYINANRTMKGGSYDSLL